MSKAHWSDEQELLSLARMTPYCTSRALIRRDDVSAVELRDMAQRDMMLNLSYEIVKHLKPESRETEDGTEITVRAVALAPGDLVGKLRDAYEIGRKRGLLDYMGAE